MENQKNKQPKRTFWGTVVREWTKFSRWRANKKYDFKDRLRFNLVKVFGVFMFTAFGLIVYSNVTPRPSNVESTPLNEAQTFGTLGKSATLTSRDYNPNTGTLVLKFRLSDGSESLSPIIDTTKIKFDFSGENHTDGERSKVYVVPTSNSSVAVQFVHLNKGFRSVKVKLTDKSIDPNAITVSNNQQENSSENNTKQPQVKQTSTEFIVNNDQLKKDVTLPVQSQKTLALEQNKTDIKDTQKYIHKVKKGIEEWKKSIKEQEGNIALANENMANADDDSKASLQNNIESYQSNIEETQRKITSAKTDIDHANDRIDKLEEYHQDILNDDMKLPKPY
ncbi:hypothetical protein JK159_02470 [Weissella minor]|uniref:hypothetical protein n=1 Tax=Weissella minor TaxID=1620 RepID=UPI001BAF13C4|nr:hypothetical protein [Weissella minor]MBS0949248.1 hypothetical protein [Weissella minor]